MTVLKGSRYAVDEVFVVQGADGSKVLSRRRPFVIPEDPDDQLYITNQGDTFWYVAGLRSIYGEPELYWVIAEANPEVPFFQGQITGLDAGVELRIPPADKVRSRIGGRASSRIPVR